LESRERFDRERLLELKREVHPEAIKKGSSNLQQEANTTSLDQDL